MTPSPEPCRKESGRQKAVGTSACNLRDTDTSGNGHLGAGTDEALSMPRAVPTRLHESYLSREDSVAAQGAEILAKEVSGILEGITQIKGGGKCFELTREALRRQLRRYAVGSRACAVRDGVEVISAVTHEVERAIEQSARGTLPRARLKGDTPKAHCLMLLKLSAETRAAEQWVLELEQSLEQSPHRTRSLQVTTSVVNTELQSTFTELGAFVALWQSVAGEHRSKCPEPLWQSAEQVLGMLQSGLRDQAGGADWIAICLSLECLGKSLASHRSATIKSLGQVLQKKERDLLVAKLQGLKKAVARAAIGPLAQELTAMTYPPLRGELAFCRHVASSLCGALVNCTTLSSTDRFGRDLLTTRQHPAVLAERRLSDVLSALQFVLATLGPELSRRREGDDG